ncbi:MAG: DNA polymerase III subunit delta [Gemmatimonadaceae bacterium]|nr:DNA polymerase III subunit delta [Gemmatimonadaceae bacterium]
MPPITPRALRTAIDAGSFDPVTVLFGDEDYVKDELLRQFIARAVDDTMRDFNVDVRRGPELDAAELSSTLEQLPMMADRRVVVIRDAHALKKAPMSVLDQYLAKPSRDVALVLLLPADETLPKQWPSHLTLCECKPLSEDSVLKWVAHHLKETLQCGITPDAASLLVSHVGNDLAMLRGELDKLVSYTNGAEITADAVQAVVGIRHGETLADLLDCVAQRDAKHALAMLPRVMAQPKTTGVSVVIALTAQTFALAWGAAARANGTPIGQLNRAYFDVLREGGAFLGRPWGEAIQHLIKALPQWDAERCDRALDLLLATDLALKDTKASTEEQIVEGLVLALCV